MLYIIFIVPHLFLFSMLQMRLCWRFVANAHVRTSAVVELNEAGNEFLCLFKGGQLFPRMVFESCCYHNAIIEFGRNRVDA